MTDKCGLCGQTKDKCYPACYETYFENLEAFERSLRTAEPYNHSSYVTDVLLKRDKRNRKLGRE